MRSSSPPANARDATESVGLHDSLARDIPIINTRLDPGTYSEGLVDLMLEFLVPRESVYRQELADWAAELRSLSAEGKYFFSTTRCFFGVTKPAATEPKLEQVEDVHAPL